MSPLASNETVPCSVFIFAVWIASRTAARVTGLPVAATRFTASMMTSVAS